MLSQHDLISALTSLPERELVDVVAVALERRDSEFIRPQRDAVRLRMAEPRRFADAHRPQRTGEPASPAGCCGLTFSSHAKRIVCPLCGKPSSAT